MSWSKSAFAARIAELGLRHISPDELLVRTLSKNRFGTQNSRPPLRLWDNIIPTAIILDELRATSGRKITLLSGYRSEAYNQASDDKTKGYTGRAKRSQHMAFSAIDFRVEGVPCTEVEKHLMIWRDANRLFFSRVWFERKGEKVSAGNIPFGEIPRASLQAPSEFRCAFYFRGFLKSYPSENFTHIDTRGLTSSMEE